MNYEAVCENFWDEFTSINQWMTSILIYSEELGRERGYFNEK
jgi:hypothetical protein